MAWRSSGKTQAELILNLRSHGLIKSAGVARCLQETDRKHYVSEHQDPYQDAPQHIKGTDATISAPHMHALAFEMLDLEECVRTAQSADKGIRILDIGCGSGYLLAAMHRFIQANLSVSLAAKSLVVGVDHVVRLTSLSRQNLLADGLGDALNNGRIIIETADGRLGSAHYAGFDAIHVGAAAQDGVPPALLAQLNAPGRLVLPLGTYGGDQVMTIVKKDAQGFVTQEKRFGVRYVPLC